MKKTQHYYKHTTALVTTTKTS